MNGGPNELTAMIGREVYTQNGVFVGEIEDLRLDTNKEIVNGVAIGNINRDLFQKGFQDTGGVMLPYRWVRSVGDVVLVSDVVERYRTEEHEDDAVAA